MLMVILATDDDETGSQEKFVIIMWKINKLPISLIIECVNETIFGLQPQRARDSLINSFADIKAEQTVFCDIG